jgi:hypothetical protein
LTTRYLLLNSDLDAVQGVDNAAEVNSSDTFVYLDGLESTEANMDAILNFNINDGGVDDVIDITAITAGMNGIISGAFFTAFDFDSVARADYTTLAAQANLILDGGLNATDEIAFGGLDVKYVRLNIHFNARRPKFIFNFSYS